MEAKIEYISLHRVFLRHAPVKWVVEIEGELKKDTEVRIAFVKGSSSHPIEGWSTVTFGLNRQVVALDWKTAGIKMYTNIPATAIR